MPDPSPNRQARPVRPCQHPRAHHEHGTRAAYVLDRCRCPACSTANTTQARKRTTEIAYGRWQGLVDATAARQHVQALRDAGLSLPRISILAGVGQGTLNGLIYGEPARGKPPSARLRSDTATRLLGVTPRAVSTAGERKVQEDVSDLGCSGRPSVAPLRHAGRVAHEARAALNATSGTPLPACSGSSGPRRPDLDQDARRGAHNRVQVSPRNGVVPREGLTLPPADRSSRDRRLRSADHRAAAALESGRLAGNDRDASADPDDLDEAADLPLEEDLDTVAIERAMTGEPVPLTTRERHEAIDRLTRQGRSAAHIANLLHVNPRTITRARAAQRTSAA